MKGIVLTGGLGTRLYPVTKMVNKHVLPVFDRPMFFWPLKTLVDSGIKEIVIVSGPPFGDQIKTLISEFKTKKKVKLVYVNQPKPLGMPDAINKCRSFVAKDSIIVSAGDNIYGSTFENEKKSFTEGAMAFLRKVPDPERFGVPYYDFNGKLIRIEEKPKKPQTNWAVTGPHIFDNQVFKYIERLKPSARSELEISDLNNIYLQQNKLKLIKRSDYWQDMGTFDSLWLAGKKIKKIIFYKK